MQSLHKPWFTNAITFPGPQWRYLMTEISTLPAQRCILSGQILFWSAVFSEANHTTYFTCWTTKSSNLLYFPHDLWTKVYNSMTFPGLWIFILDFVTFSVSMTCRNSIWSKPHKLTYTMEMVDMKVWLQNIEKKTWENKKPAGEVDKDPTLKNLSLNKCTNWQEEKLQVSWLFNTQAPCNTSLRNAFA